MRPRSIWCLGAIGMCGLLLVSCTTKVEPGEARVVTQGVDPSTLTAPSEPEGGLVEVGRVWFAGNNLSTDLVGDAEPVDSSGWTVTVGAARFKFPRSGNIGAYAQIIPVGPELEDGATMQCTVVRGPVAGVQHSDVAVDAGDELHLADEDGKVLFDVHRTPLTWEGTPSAPIAYFAIERTRSPDDLIGPGNWKSGAAISARMGGGNPAKDSRFAAIPFAFTFPGTIRLPLKLSGVAIDGEPVQGPVRVPDTGEVVEPAPTWDLPAAGKSLLLTWDVWSTTQTMVLSLEYYGGGSGRCPSACNQGVCCEQNDQCSGDEVCATRRTDGQYVCMPRAGDGHDRLGALVCSLADTGAGTLTGEQVQAFESQLEDWGVLDAVRGVVLRLGRVWSARVTLPDVMMADGTAQTISPVLIRTSDEVIVRMQRVEP